MAHILTFREEYTYSSDRGIAIPVTLAVGQMRMRLLAKLDTGSQFCIFTRDRGEALGLDIETGQFQRMKTATSEFETFGHEVTIETFGWSSSATAFFARDREFSREVLGRNGWIHQFRLGIVDYESKLYLSHFNEQ